MKPTYEELESQLAALAAELSAIDAIHNDAVFITDAHYEQCPPEAQKIIGALAVLQIPAYESFLAEVRAQGVELAINHIEQTITPNHETILNEFAAKLRKGGEV